MVTGDFWVLFAMLLYFIVVVIIGFIYAKKSNRSTEEYFLGGRSLGPWLTALSAEASDMSGYLLMGLPGLAYFCGANEAVWTAIGLAIGTYLNWKFVAKRLRKYSEVAGNAITIPDFFSNRFHDKKNILMTIAAVIILLFFSIYVGSCFVTCGKLFATLFGLDYATMMVLGALDCVPLYCSWVVIWRFHYRPDPGNDHDLRACDRFCRLGRAGGRCREHGRLLEFAAGLLERHSASSADR